MRGGERRDADSTEIGHKPPDRAPIASPAGLAVVHTLWLAIIYGIPCLFVFHWGLDILDRNPKDSAARVIAAQHAAFFLMLVLVFAIEVLPLAAAPAIAIAGIGSLGVILVALGVHLVLRVMGWMDRWRRGVGVLVAYLWTLPGIWTLATGRNLFNVSRFFREGLWVEPYYNAPFHAAMWVAVGITTLVAAGLWRAGRTAATPERRGQIGGLFWGAVLLTLMDLGFGALLPDHPPVWMPPYPYLLGMLMWIIAVRIAMTRYAFLPSRLERYRNLFTLTPVPIVMVSATGAIVDMNPAAWALIGERPASLLDIMPDADEAVGRNFRAAWARREPIRGWSATIQGRDGLSHVVIDGEYLSADDHEYCTMVLRDITVEQQEQAVLSQLAYHDALTGLPNSTLFQRRLADAIGPGPSHVPHFAVFWVDLDNFKLLNDTLGHQAGNAALREVAARLTQHRREQDAASRLGGDEFAILLAGVQSPDVARALADRLRAELSAPLGTPAVLGFQLTASIGVSLYPLHGQDGDALLRAADIAMYAGKRAGKNRVVTYQPTGNPAETWPELPPWDGAAVHLAPPPLG